jgi:hypothetical protein
MVKDFPFDPGYLEQLALNSHENRSKIYGRESNAAYTLVYGDGVVERPNVACHSALSGPAPGCVAVVNQIQRMNRSETAFFRDYYWYLFNESPYSSAFLTKNPDNIWETGVVLTADVHHNFFFLANCAVRMPWEESRKFRCHSFLKMLDEGKVSKDMAYLLHLSFSIDNDIDYSKGTFATHTSLNTSVMTKHGFKNFLLHRPNPDLSQTYYKVGSYSNANLSWNYGSLSDEPFDFTPSSAVDPIVDPWGLIKRTGGFESLSEWANKKEQEILAWTRYT